MNCMEVAEGPLSNTLLCTLEKFRKKHYRENMDLQFLKGEKFQFPDLSGHRDGLELLEAEFIEDCYGKDDVIYEHFVYVFELKIKADVCIYPLDDDICEDHLVEKIVRWIVPEDRYNDNRKIINHKIIDSNNTYHTISVTLLCEINFADKVIKSPFHDEVTYKIMHQFITEGVCYSKEKVSKELEGELQKEIDFLAKYTETDFHPNSNNIVRDLVHPSLYLYVNGVSVIKESSTYKCVYEAFDFWGRPYESSGYQWLPTQFYISSDSKCKINDYINNLDENKFQQLYVALEKLFQVFLPYFEDVWSYTKAMKVYEEGKDPEYFVKEPVSFKDKELQVIVKIVQYTLQPNGFYEGVWHAEGMSHENIVMTGIYFLDRDVNICGGDLHFKRSFTNHERELFHSKFHRGFDAVTVSDFVQKGFMPLGRFPTEEGYLLVFPNSHIHKLEKMVNISSDQSASRRIVVFFVVNPDRKIISTSDVERQQTVMSLDEAKQHRLESMNERKYDKAKLNVREVELCEH